MLAPLSVTLPAPTLVKAKAPETMPSSVRLPAPPIELLAAMTTAPGRVTALVASLLIKAPLLPMPTPLKLKALATA